MKAPQFWWSDAPSWRARLLAPAGRIYAKTITDAFTKTTPFKASVPVFCAGNLVAGGAGKTPTSLWLAKALQSRGHKPAFLTRGYGGTEKSPLVVSERHHDAARVGDEALLLSTAGLTIVARDRAEGARLAVEKGATAIIMDDGFQNPGLAKDCGLVVIDAERGFGNGLCIPAGPLREPPGQGFARAQGALVLGGTLEQRTATAERLVPAHLPVVTGRLVPGRGCEWVAGQPLTAFAGIGAPERFFATLEELGAELKGRFEFPDHHPYKPQDMILIERHARSTHSIPITTEKDAVRLPVSMRGKIAMIRVDLELDDRAPLDRLIDQTLTAHLAAHAN